MEGKKLQIRSAMRFVTLVRSRRVRVRLECLLKMHDFTSEQSARSARCCSLNLDAKREKTFAQFFFWPRSPMPF